MYYPEGMKARVSPVQWSKPNSILAPTQDSNPGGRIQNHKRWPLHYHCTLIYRQGNLACIYIIQLTNKERILLWTKCTYFLICTTAIHRILMDTCNSLWNATYPGARQSINPNNQCKLHSVVVKHIPFPTTCMEFIASVKRRNRKWAWCPRPFPVPSVKAWEGGIQKYLEESNCKPFPITPYPMSPHFDGTARSARKKSHMQFLWFFLFQKEKKLIYNQLSNCNLNVVYSSSFLSSTRVARQILFLCEEVQQNFRAPIGQHCPYPAYLNATPCDRISRNCNAINGMVAPPLVLRQYSQFYNYTAKQMLHTNPRDHARNLAEITW